MEENERAELTELAKRLIKEYGTKENAKHSMLKWVFGLTSEKADEILESLDEPNV